MAEENLVDDALARAAARGFEFCLQLVDAMAFSNSAAIMRLLQEVADGSAIVDDPVADELAALERLRGSPFSPEVRRRQIDALTPSWRKLVSENQEFAGRIADCMANDLRMNRRVPQGASAE